MSHTGIMRDHEADEKERSESDFPIICKSCIVDNPYVQMTKGYVNECKICTRPYTVFMWRPTYDAYKKTKVCQTCNKLKNVCQVCLLDLEHDQVRDTAPLNIRTHDSIPKSYMKIFDEEHDWKILQRWPGLVGSFGMTEPDDMIRKRQRRLPFFYGMKIKEPICSFYISGGCVRGATCPYPHEMPKPGENNGASSSSSSSYAMPPHGHYPQAPYHQAEPQGLILNQAQSQLHHLTLESGEPSSVNRNLHQ